MKVILSVRKLSAAVLAGVLLFSVSACGQGGDPAPSASSSQSTDASASPSAFGSTPSASSSAPAGTGTLDDVKVEVKNDGKDAPALTLGKALADGPKATAKVVKEGTGAALSEGKNLVTHFAYFDDATGKALGTDESYSTTQDIPLTEASFTGVEPAYELFKKAKVGTTVVVHLPATITQSSGRIMVMHVSDQVTPPPTPKTATESEVKKLKDAGALPTVEFAKDGKPTITIPKGKDAPADLIVDVLKEGTGKAATAESTVTAKYLGVNWAKGEKFDSSYDRTPDTTEFPLTGVIAGWTKGLTGVKEGSTVVLTIPQSMAYPNAAEGEATHGPLVFVVELTKVS